MKLQNLFQPPHLPIPKSPPEMVHLLGALPLALFILFMTWHRVPVKLTELTQDGVSGPWLTAALGGPRDRKRTPSDDPRPDCVDVDS